jgi:hypothetical protein
MELKDPDLVSTNCTFAEPVTVDEEFIKQSINKLAEEYAKARAEKEPIRLLPRTMYGMKVVEHVDMKGWMLRNPIAS